MKTQKLLICTLVAAVIIFVVDYLFYAVLMADFFSSSHMRETPNFGMLILGILVFSFFFCYIYPHGVEGDNQVMQGLRYGVTIALFTVVSFGLIQYAVFDVAPFNEYLVDMIYKIVQLGIVGIVVATLVGGGSYGTRGPVDPESENGDA